MEVSAGLATIPTGLDEPILVSGWADAAEEDVSGKGKVGHICKGWWETKCFITLNSKR